MTPDAVCHLASSTPLPDDPWFWWGVAGWLMALLAWRRRRTTHAPLRIKEDDPVADHLVGDSHRFHVEAVDDTGAAVALTAADVVYAATPDGIVTGSAPDATGGIVLTFVAPGTATLACKVRGTVDATPLAVTVVARPIASATVVEDA